MLRTFLRWFVITVVCSIGVPLVAGVTVLASLIFLPLPASLPTPKPGLVSLPSTVFDADGNVIATFQQFDQSIPVQEKDIPQVLKEALVASEDKNFFHEGGVDPRGTLRAFVRDLQGNGYLQGGSTITQQYVALAYTGKQRTFTRKLREAILASQLARKLPKDEILYKYLSAVYFGDGMYGIGAAAQGYFHLKDLHQMTIGEAAALIGLIPAPSRYEPRGNPALAEQRRETVLLKMFQQHYINLAQYQFWKVSQLYPANGPALPKGAPATYFYPAEQQPVQYPYFVDYLRRYLELAPGIGPDLLYRGGLRIQTTLDPKLQTEAQASVARTLFGTSPPLEMALVSIEPQTGYVRALIGGRDFSQDQTNLALGGCESPPASAQVLVASTCQQAQVPQGGGTGRQPGSSFKPFVLATAFAHGVLPTTVINGPQSIALPLGCKGSGCQVIHNAGDSESGVFTLQQATWYSVNTVYAQLILDPRVTVQQTAETAKALGITSAWYSPQVHGASYALGAIDVSPLDMASAYGVFDNHGSRVPPTPVLLVEGPNGKVLVDNRKPVGTQVLGSVIADNVTNVLKGVITQPGATAYGSANIGRPAAGKTGTTSSYVDAWFVGYTPTLVTSVWMGRKNSEDPAKGASMTSVCSPARHVCASPVFGGTLPALTWADYMRQAMQGVPVTDFNQPAPLTPIADAIDARLRGGVSPGARRYPVPIGGGGPYVSAPPPLVAPEPTTSTSTTSSTSSTTSTTVTAR
ncbi:MAG TPA: transglycosylase domain-containing protein [Acidimicrobiales bacterium]|nr:transglycosylase domain-containing protein [Acidimicrobiales bacterium]